MSCQAGQEELMKKKANWTENLTDMGRPRRPVGGPTCCS